MRREFFVPALSVKINGTNYMFTTIAGLVFCFVRLEWRKKLSQALVKYKYMAEVN